MKKYIATGKYIDLRETFETMVEAENQIKTWIFEDRAEGLGDTENDYYIIIEEVV